MKNRLLLLFCWVLCSFSAIAQGPTPNFNSNIVSGCSPIVVDFKDRSTGGATSWKWDFGNGATSTRQNPTATYFQPGTYTIKLTATNASGSNTITKASYITVYTEPVAAFTSNKTNGCFPAAIQFFNQSSAPSGTTITSWKWDFGDGSSSTQQNPQHVYSAEGSYTVTLSVITSAGCKKLVTKPNFINVTTGITPNFSFSNTDVCSAPATINFTNTSTGPGTLSYNWSFGNGATSSAPNTSNYYAITGNYRVSLTVSSSQGCIDSSVKDIQVGKALTSFTTPTSICPKIPVSFVNTSTPRPLASYWKFSNGQTDSLRNASASFATPGTYTVTLINTYNDCVDTLVKTITVQSPPVVNFSARDTAKCQPVLTTSFSNTSNGASYIWDFGDSTTSTEPAPTHSYSAYGVYNVTLIATGANGCSDTLTKPGFIKIQKPIISFPGMPLEGCIPFTNVFKARIQGVDSAVSYRWDFGDTAGTSTLKEPTYTYTRQGTFAVTLTITTSTGCTETYTLPEAIMVGTIPIPDFIATTTTGCADPGIQFTNLSTGALQYAWEFSDGSVSNELHPLHTFIDTGWVNVKLTAINNGCTEFIEKLSYVYIKPSISRFDYRPDCNNRRLITFTDRSIDARSWKWDFGDGTSFEGQTPPQHVFPSDGSYNVTLTTTNGACTYKLVRKIVIGDQTPDFSANITEGCKPMLTTFQALPKDRRAIANFIWDLGDGRIIDNEDKNTLAFTYLKSGVYTVKLTTIDTFGCKYSFTKDAFIKVNGSTPKFGAIDNSGCRGVTTTFIDSTISTNTIVSWRWDFGDSTTATYTAPPFQHVYDSVGDYDVKLVVTDATGCKDSITSRSFVKVSFLKADFAFVNNNNFSCPGGPIDIRNRTTSEFPYTSTWTFGDGQDATEASPRHIYSDTGYYTVTLIAKDIVGCQDTLRVDSAVHIARPKAAFDANNFTSYCTPFEAKFINTSYFYRSSLWDFGTQGTSTQTNPTTYFTDTRTYPIKLVVTSRGGCQDSITQNVTIFNTSDANFNYSPLDGCTPLEVNLSAFSPMNGRFIWDFGDGNVIDTTVNALSHRYTDFGDFIPRIILKEPSGTCVIPLEGKETIKLLGAKADFAIDSSFFCDQGTVNLSDSTTTNDPALRYNWSFGDGKTSTVQSPTHLYDTSGIFTITLSVTTQNGCKDTITKGPVKIIARPEISMLADSVICLNDKVSYTGVFERVDTSEVKWMWTFPNGSTSQSANPAIQQYSTAGSYTVTAIATNSSGCKDTASTNLLVNPLPVVTMPPTLTKIVGVPVTLAPTFSPNIMSYTWVPGADLSCTDCPAPISTTKFNTLYKVAVVDSNGCTNSGQVQVIVLCKGATIFVPNTFSPNGDGANEVLYVRGVGLARVKSFRIYNRWGEMIFNQRDFAVNDPSVGWNGTYKSTKAQADVYIYQAEVFCENGEIIRFDGNINLIR